MNRFKRMELESYLHRLCIFKEITVEETADKIIKLFKEDRLNE